MDLSTKPLAAAHPAAGRNPIANALSRIPRLLLARREDLLLLAFAVAIVAATRAVLSYHGVEQVGAWVYVANTQLYIYAIVLVMLLRVVFGPLRISRRSISFDISHFSLEGEARGIIASLVAIFALSTFMVNFSSFKSSIEVLNPFAWDQTFITLDRAIHGDDPWRLLQPLLGHPGITRMLSGAYHLWFLLIYIGPVWFAIYQKDRVLRLRFFLAYFMTWTICGMVLAVALSSVGPCFVQPLLGNAHFAEQMAYLHAVDDVSPLFVIDIQERLLQWHESGRNGLGHGITAMPSMHVALAVVYALAMGKVGKPFAWLFGAFAIVIAVASVHLAYHYAVDGYLAAIVTVAIWMATKPLAGWIMERLTPARGAPLGENQGLPIIHQT